MDVMTANLALAALVSGEHGAPEGEKKCSFTFSVAAQINYRY